MPLTDMILWQDVPIGSTVRTTVVPEDKPILADGVHRLENATLEEADDTKLRPGPHSFDQFGQPGDHTVDIRVANQGTNAVSSTVTATLFDRAGILLAGPKPKPRSIPVGDFFLVSILVKVAGGAGARSASRDAISPTITVGPPTASVVSKPSKAPGKKKGKGKSKRKDKTKGKGKSKRGK